MKIYNDCNNNIFWGIKSKNLAKVANMLENKCKTYPAIEDFFVNGEMISVPKNIEKEIMKHMEEYAHIVDTNEAKAIGVSKHLYLNV